MAVAFKATNINFCACCVFLLLPLDFPTPAVAAVAARHWQTCWKAATQAGEFQLKMMAALFWFSFSPNCLHSLAEGCDY